MTRIEIDLTLESDDDSETLSARSQYTASRTTSTGRQPSQSPLNYYAQPRMDHARASTPVSSRIRGLSKHRLDQDEQGDHGYPVLKRARLEAVAVPTGSSPEDVIVIQDSDDDVEDITPIHVDSDQDDDTYDSEDEYRRKNASYNVSSTRNWNGMWISYRGPVLDVDNTLPGLMATFNVPSIEEGPACKAKQALHKGLDILRTKRSRADTHVPAFHTICAKMRGAGLFYGLVPTTSEARFKREALEFGLRGRGYNRRHLSLSGRFDVSCLHSVMGLCRAGGAINTVVQSGNILAASSSLATTHHAPMGEFDQEACDYRPTLQLLLHDEIFVSRDHKERLVRHGHSRVSVIAGQTYSVEAVAIDPNVPHRMVTASNDGFVTVRDINDVIGASSIFRSNPAEAHGQYPRSLQFRYSDSALAIPHSDGSIYIHKFDGPRADEIEHHVQAKLNASRGDSHNVVHMVWGLSNMLYAVSEAENTAHCVAYDIQRPNMPFKFPDIHESGEALAIDSSGRNVVVFTRDRDYTHKLRIYDVARQNCQSTLALDLKPFSFERCADRKSRVTTASFSPDELLIAVGRNDDQLHLYDTRYMAKGPILQCKHWEDTVDMLVPESGQNNDSSSCGIVRMEWMQAWDGRGLGFVSGGGDGCVRVWDALGSENNSFNGEVIARLNSAVSDFSLGEQFKGEKPLVVGDKNGGIYIYEQMRRME